MQVQRFTLVLGGHGGGDGGRAGVDEGWWRVMVEAGAGAVF